MAARAKPPPATGHRPGVGVGVEDHSKARRIVGFCLHRNDTFRLLVDVDFSESHLLNTGGIVRSWSGLSGPGQGRHFSGSRLGGRSAECNWQGERKASQMFLIGCATISRPYRHPTDPVELPYGWPHIPRAAAGLPWQGTAASEKNTVPRIGSLRSEPSTTTLSVGVT